MRFLCLILMAALIIVELSERALAAPEATCNITLNDAGGGIPEIMATCESANISVSAHHDEPQTHAECKLEGPSWNWSVSVIRDPDGPGPLSGESVECSNVLSQCSGNQSTFSFTFSPNGVGCWTITYNVSASWDGSDDCNGCRDDCPSCSKSKSGSVSIMVIALSSVEITDPEGAIWVEDTVTAEASFVPEGVTPPSSGINWSLSDKPDSSSATISGQGLTATVTPDLYGDYSVQAAWKCSQIALASFVAFDVSITGGRADNKSVIGLNNVLTATVMPNDNLVESYSWTIPGSTCKTNTLNTADFTSIPQSSVTTPLGYDDLNDKTVSFCWTAPSTVTIQLAIRVGPDTKNAERTIEVVAPSDARFSNVSQLLASNITLTQNELVYKNTSVTPNTKGISWDAELTAPAEFAGRLGIVQLIKSARSKTSENNPDATNAGDQKRTSSFGASAMFLDRKSGSITPMYDNLNVVVSAGQTGMVSGSDSPNCLFFQFDAKATVDDSFETYVMWRPDGEGSIWIAMEKVTWGWKAEVLRKDLNCDSFRDTWEFGSAPSIQNSNQSDFFSPLEWSHHHQTVFENTNSQFWNFSNWTAGLHSEGWCQ